MGQEARRGRGGGRRLSGDQLDASELARRAGEVSDEEWDDAADLELNMWDQLSDEAEFDWEWDEEDDEC